MPDSETIEFRLLNTRLPTSFGCDRWGALVYAGEDGSFISYSARGFDHIWTRLRQTRNDTKYWRVSIPCTTGIGRDAQLLMAHAFSKVPYSGGAEAMHLDTDHDNNESDNIRFGNDQSNQAIANDAVNKRRNDYWRAQIMVEKELGMPITLPAINDFETK